MKKLALLALVSCNLVVGDYKVVPRDGGMDVDTSNLPFHDISAAQYWTSFDLKTVDAQAGGYVGGAFDGRYVYFSPYKLGAKYMSRIARYEIAKPLDDPGAWTFFDLASVDAGASGYAGTVFANGMIYFVPGQNPAGAHGLAIRYDTTQSFTSTGSYQKIDLAKLMPMGVRGFFGGIFDGRYVVFAPNVDFVSHGLTARYDTMMAFTDMAAWSIFDLAKSDMNETGFFGAAYDGNFTYLASFSTGWGVQLKVSDPDPLLKATTLNIPSFVDSRAKGYVGAALIKNAIYYVPAVDSLVLRYNTGAPFAQIGFDAFDIGNITNARGWVGAATDGQYVYYAPYAKAFSMPRNGVVLRYDTRLDFKRDSSYSTFDTTTLTPQAAGFNGAIFDGKYLYFVPRTDGVVARFDARDNRAPLPMGYTGSFL